MVKIITQAPASLSVAVQGFRRMVGNPSRDLAPLPYSHQLTCIVVLYRLVHIHSLSLRDIVGRQVEGYYRQLFNFKFVFRLHVLDSGFT